MSISPIAGATVSADASRAALPAAHSTPHSSSTLKAPPVAGTSADPSREASSAAQGTSATGSSADSRRAAEQAAADQAAPADPQAVFQTGAYLQQLLVAQTFGGGIATPRPAHITPERLAAYVTFLENEIRVRPVDPDADSGPVDVKG